MDMYKLKQENEKIVEISREKKQKSNHYKTQICNFLWWEKRKNWNMLQWRRGLLALKEKEQGKTGELNQLLNAVTPMQEKTVSYVSMGEK